MYAELPFFDNIKKECIGILFWGENMFISLFPDTRSFAYWR